MPKVIQNTTVWYPLAPNNGKEICTMATLLSPALYGFRDVEDAWVKLSELALQFGMNPKDLWDRFFSLTKTETHLTVVYDSWGAATQWEAEEDGRDFEHPGKWVLGAKEAFDRILQNGDFYVPAGWAKFVISMHKLNARRYEHPVFKAGTAVRVSAEYAKIHPFSPLPGQIVMAWYGVEYVHPSMHAIEDEVPILLNGSIWYVAAKFLSRGLV